MIADVPLGAFLSGGIDSSIIVALMAQQSNRPIQTFTIGFEEQDYSELPYARAVAERYKTDHHEFIVKPHLIDVLPKLAWHYSEPYADSSALPSYYLTHETRQHVTVALNGDGGDEVFAGYLRYRAMWLMQFWNILPQGLRESIGRMSGGLPPSKTSISLSWRIQRLLSVGALTPTRQYLRTLDYFHPEELAELWTDEHLQVFVKEDISTSTMFEGTLRNYAPKELMDRLMYLDLRHYLPDCLMVKMDIASMANSLETRSPFLDHILAEEVARWPASWKYQPLNYSKKILKETFAKDLPPSILRRGKQGFGVPISQWFRGPLKSYLRDVILSPEALARGYFRPEVITRYVDEHQSGKRDRAYGLWALLMLELWHREAESNDMTSQLDASERTYRASSSFLVISVFFRCWGLKWGLPRQERFTTLYVDEYTPLWVLHQMDPRHGDFNPHYSHNPTFFYYQIGVALALASKSGFLSLGNDKASYLQHPEQYARLYLAARLLCVVYGVAMTLLLFFLGRRITASDAGGLLTSLFYAVIPVSAIQCHVIDTSVPGSFWVALSFLWLLKSLDTHETKWLYGGALAAGLSLSTKYTCAPIGLLVMYTAWKLDRRLKPILIALFIAGAAYAIGTPYILLDTKNMLSGMLAMSQAASGMTLAPSWRFVFYPFIHYGYAVGILISVLAVVGFVRQAREGRPAVILSALFLFPFLGLLGRSNLHIARYLNETLPFILPFAAYSIVMIYQRPKPFFPMGGHRLHGLMPLARALHVSDGPFIGHRHRSPRSGFFMDDPACSVGQPAWDWNKKPIS